MNRVKQPLSNKQVIVVLGPGRSGTSAVTQVIGELGARISDEVIQAREDNPTGHFEDKFIVEQHKQLIALLAHSPTLPLPSGWQDDPAVKPVKNELLQYVEQMLEADQTLWCFKDPRTANLLPLWISIFNRLGINPLYVLCVRDPGAVSFSLKRTINRPAAITELMWLGRVCDALYYTGGNCHLVHYEKLLADPQPTVGKLAERLFDDAGAGLIAQAAATLKPGLNRAAINDTPVQNRFVKGIYAELLKLDGSMDDKTALMAKVMDARAAMLEFQGWPHSVLSTIAARDKRINNLEKAKENADNQAHKQALEQQRLLDLQQRNAQLLVAKDEAEQANKARLTAAGQTEQLLLAQLAEEKDRAEKALKAQLAAAGQSEQVLLAQLAEARDEAEKVHKADVAASQDEQARLTRLVEARDETEKKLAAEQQLHLAAQEKNRFLLAQLSQQQQDDRQAFLARQHQSDEQLTRSLTAKLHQTQLQLEQLQQRLNNAKEQANRPSVKLQQQNEQLAAKHLTAQTGLAAAKQALNAGHELNRHLQSKNHYLTEQLSQQQQQRCQALAKKSTMMHDNENKVLKTRLHNSKEEAKRLKIQLEQIRGAAVVDARDKPGRADGKVTRKSATARVKAAAQSPLQWQRKAGLMKKLGELMQISRSGLFDRHWYSDRYQDVKASRLSPLLHYVWFGCGEGREPFAGFNAQQYLRNHPEVIENDQCPLYHYIREAEKK